MTGPTTIQGESDPHGGIDWNDHASIHRRPEGNKSDMLRGFQVIRDGTFAEMVRFVAALPEDERQHLVIQKSGDRLFELGEIMNLARRDDMPQA
ncbi:hypothetical protein [Croceicoccus marinus]|uniref:Uncharacterized protein n=1 Tax=Croceicoccus marinus TaxID=450378 RepID=A0A1Z1F8T4_9SPHN|nr:hypothetical protein [Croceicoccus marinus]ARU15201.1 hypothetical protein A9D14_02165 [Croceicoccus marinus]